ncbi:Acetylxylan esterase [termite gut metagenome]|uniref:Acetylxylan esterase n=1 Tax=termite gut metagenome TaxID=433724 RepID=A0A5J4QTY6_9ZZZZ
MKKTVNITFVLLLISISIVAQNPFKMKIWKDGVPDSNGITTPEMNEGNGRVLNVSDPDITIYPADKTKNTGITVLICPGGGYVQLAMKHEGSDFAEWLAENGITGVVLKYRMPNHHHQIPLEDVQKAMSILRENAASWSINPNKIGVMGFSAGGHLASTLLTHFDSISRPDFGVLFYPVVTSGENLTHKGSFFNLTDETDDKALINYYSNEKQVKPNTPSVLLFHSNDDKTVAPENSTLFYEALRANGISSSLHIFPSGGHGWGFNTDYAYHQLMKDILLDWINMVTML